MKMYLPITATLIIIAMFMCNATIYAAEETGCIELELPYRIKSAVFSPDGKLIVTGGEGKGDDDGAIIWERSTGKKLRTLQHGSSISLVAFSPDGKKIAISGFDATQKCYNLIIWDVATGDKEQTLLVLQRNECL